MSDRLAPDLLARYCLELFEKDARGVAVLEALVQRFSQPAVLDGENAAFKTYHRMGQHSVIQFLLHQINRANGVNDTPSTVEIDQ